MKKRIALVFSLASVAICVYVPALEASKATVNQPQHATGGVVASAGGGIVFVSLTFNAHAATGNQPVKGKVKYTNTFGEEFRGTVNVCYNQVGNVASFAGTVESGNVNFPFFRIEVQDNGEGEESPPDMIRVLGLYDVPTCEITGQPATVIQGNLQVHQ